MNTELTIQEKRSFEPMAKVLAANGIAQSLSFASERKYLNGISSSSSPFSLKLASKRVDLPNAPYWIKITQVGKPVDDRAESCFTAIQKILSACHLPNKTQLIFLVNGEHGVYEIYLGVRSYNKSNIDVSFVDSLTNFIKGLWPGIKCQRMKGNVDTIRNSISKRYDSIDALTGIPSMESQYKTFYPATIDTLMAGMKKKNFAYMVIADPIEEADVDGMLYLARDFCGQAESLKSFNYSENTSNSVSVALSKSKAICDGSSESKQVKSRWGMVGAGIMLASAIFPPAGVLTTALAIVDGANTIAGSNLLAEFSPSKTTGISHSETTNEGRTDSTSRSTGQSISSNIVNKQIEAVTEQLSAYSKRLETGKALGCWTVGVYLMAENRHEIQGASMQLKSITSGQGSTFEPIRIHHIEDVIGDNISQTLGCFSSPAINIQGLGGLFVHPMGRHFSDLKTVLTTKELSYFVNFPLHSVPGINVVDVSPSFSMAEQKIEEGQKSISIGKLLWSGSSTDIHISLPLNTLSRHALVCGVNGSGKTNSVLSILDDFMKENRPFFVIEPAKTEYVDWALEYNKTIQDPDKKIRIFIPGCDNYSKVGFRLDKLCLNPFEVIQLPGSEMRVLSHIDRLKSSFAAAFPMQDILPVIMEHLLYDLYTEAHPMLDKEDANYMKNGFPTLGTVDRRFIDDLMINVGYAQENTQNISAALRTRFKSLKFGWKGELLNNQQLSSLVWDASSNSYKSEPLSWEQLFGAPVVVNLSYAGDDQDRAFIMSLLLQFLYEYRIAESEAGNISFDANECRHLVVVEEAHRVMAKCNNPESPLYKSAQMFSNFLSEIRAYGQGMMVVDQVPTRLIEDAIKNTNVKIIHKLVASDDCQKVAECIGLTEDQRKVIARLSIGQAVLAGFNSANVMSENSSDIYLAQINKMK